MGHSLSKAQANRKKPQEQEAQQAPQANPTTPKIDSFGRPVPDDSKLFDGRAFKKSGSPVYPLPNDKEEFQRLNFQHYLLRYMFQSNYRAPVTEGLKRGIKVLDVGCGTGAWSIDLATDFPNSTFVGTDITNVFMASVALAPSNCIFIEADTLKGLPYADGEFDFVFQRLQLFCWKEECWRGVLQELKRVTKPGGYIEFVEPCTWIMNGGPALMKHAQWYKAMGELRDVNVGVLEKPNLLIDAGLVDILSTTAVYRYGWGPDVSLGEMNSKNWIGMMESTRPHIMAALGIDDAKYNEVFELASKELIGPSEHRPFAYFKSHCGRKPLD